MINFFPGMPVKFFMKDCLYQGQVMGLATLSDPVQGRSVIVQLDKASQMKAIQEQEYIFPCCTIFESQIEEVL